MITVEHMVSMVFVLPATKDIDSVELFVNVLILKLPIKIVHYGTGIIKFA